MSDLIRVSKRALERFWVVSAILGRKAAGVSLAAAIAATLEVCRLLGRPPRVPSQRSVYRWLAAYERGGLAALEPTARRRATVSRALSARMESFLEEEKRLDPVASIPEISRRARLAGVIAEKAVVSRTTLWRAACRKGLPCRQQSRKGGDKRPFGYSNRMLMALFDGAHFRAGIRRAKRVALAFLDDATRRGLGILVTTSENTIGFLRLLYLVIRGFGRFGFGYGDHGSAFISEETTIVFARLGIGLVHGTAGYPEGRGKIERFNRSLRAQVLRGFAGNPAVDDDPAALTLRLTHWMTEVYDHTPHEGLGGETPFERWQRDPRPLDFPEPGFERLFRLTLSRRVRADNVLSVDRLEYEVPAGHAGREIEITRDLLEGSVRILHEGRSVRLALVDRIKNAHDRRGFRPASPDEDPAPVRTAAEAAFDADYAPLTDHEGGYDDDPDQKGDSDDSKNDH